MVATIRPRRSLAPRLQWGTEGKWLVGYRGYGRDAGVGGLGVRKVRGCEGIKRATSQRVSGREHGIPLVLLPELIELWEDCEGQFTNARDRELWAAGVFIERHRGAMFGRAEVLMALWEVLDHARGVAKRLQGHSTGRRTRRAEYWVDGSEVDMREIK